MTEWQVLAFYIQIMKEAEKLYIYLVLSPLSDIPVLKACLTLSFVHICTYLTSYSSYFKTQCNIVKSNLVPHSMNMFLVPANPLYKLCITFSSI